MLSARKTTSILFPETVAADCVNVELEHRKNIKQMTCPGLAAAYLTVLPDSASFDIALDALEAQGVPA